MSRTDFTFASSAYIQKDGDYRILRETAFNTISAEWVASGITPAGVFTFSVNGDPGDPPGILNLSSSARVLSVGAARLSHIDINVSGLPKGGAVILRLA